MNSFFKLLGLIATLFFVWSFFFIATAGDVFTATFLTLIIAAAILAFWFFGWGV